MFFLLYQELIKKKLNNIKYIIYTKLGNLCRCLLLPFEFIWKKGIFLKVCKNCLDLGEMSTKIPSIRNKPAGQAAGAD